MWQMPRWFWLPSHEFATRAYVIFLYVIAIGKYINYERNLLQQQQQ